MEVRPRRDVPQTILKDVILAQPSPYLGMQNKPQETYTSIATCQTLSNAQLSILRLALRRLYSQVQPS